MLSFGWGYRLVSKFQRRRFGKMSHVRMRQVWETELSNKPVGIQSNGAKSNALNGCRPGGKVESQALVPSVKQRKAGHIFVIRLEVSKSDFRSEVQGRNRMPERRSSRLMCSILCVLIQTAWKWQIKSTVALIGQRSIDRSRLIRRAGIGLKIATATLWDFKTTSNLPLQYSKRKVFSVFPINSRDYIGWSGRIVLRPCGVHAWLNMSRNTGESQNPFLRGVLKEPTHKLGPWIEDLVIEYLFEGQVINK